MKRRVGDRHPARGLPPQIEGHRIHGLAVRQTVQGLQRDHRGHHISGHARRPRPVGNKSANISSGTTPADLARNPDTARLEEMPRHRLRIENFPLIIKRPLTPQSSQQPHQPADRHADLFRSLLGSGLQSRIHGFESRHSLQELCTASRSANAAALLTC